MNEEARQARIQAILEESKRVSAEAKKALAAGERFFSEHGVDPRKLAAEVLRQGGPQAVRELEARVRLAMRTMEEGNQEAALQRRFETPGATRTRPRRMGNLV